MDECVYRTWMPLFPAKVNRSKTPERKNWQSPKLNLNKLCQLTQTTVHIYSPDSEPTSLYFYSLKLHALQRSSKYQFNSLRLDLTRVKPMIPIFQVSILTITPSLRFEQECTINIIPNMSVSQNKRIVCPPLISTVRQQKLKWVFLF